ncbi:TonB-dependent receptor [Pseudomonas sp. HK3]
MKPALLLTVLSSLSTLSIANTQLEKVVVTSTQEATSIHNLAESVGVLSKEDILNISPSHPSEVLNRTPGVYINNLGGEGHMTAIRQPITTSAVYLFLEDGIPTRPTGFFNHNGLYEVNIPQSERLEVTKGPGSALYGSDAIGGVINSISAKVPDQKQSKLDTEFGENGWQRLLFSAGSPINAYSGAAISANVTENEGFRDNGDYSRGSLNGRFNYTLSSNINVSNSLSFSQVDQSGVSSLERNDYKNNVKKNFFRGDVGARDVQALRFSSVVNYIPSQESLLTVTPFYRNNDSSMMPSWMVSYDPNFRETQFESFGLLTKWRQRLGDNSLIITGIDIDHTPSSYKEYDISVEKIEINGQDYYTGFEKNGVIHYDYDANQTSISPYIHIEHKPISNIILSAGLRYDMFNVDYDNNLAEQAIDSHNRPESQKIDYSHLSPKAGIVYHINNLHQVYVNYRHAFRAPSVGTLFRSGSSTNTTDLEPVKTDSIEVGYRGYALDNISYELAVYYMKKTDDIVGVINSENDRISLNAGESTHKGIELGLQAGIYQDILLSTSFSYSEQTYGQFEYLYNCFKCSPPVFNQVLNFNGNEVGKAPKTLGNIAVRYEPMRINGFMVELELEHVGKYYTDETNTNEYNGHDLLNLRSRYQINSQFEIYGRLQNLTDKRYSTYTSNQVGSTDIDYRPGLPLTLYAGLRLNF